MHRKSVHIQCLPTLIILRLGKAALSTLLAIHFISCLLSYQSGHQGCPQLKDSFLSCAILGRSDAIQLPIQYTYTYGARNLEISISFSLKSRASERFHRPEMSQIKVEISLRTNVKLNFHKNVGCQ